MPDPKTCAAKFKPGTKEYQNCIAYRGTSSKPASKPVSPVKGRARGGY